MYKAIFLHLLLHLRFIKQENIYLYFYLNYSCFVGAGLAQSI